jgi:hypothetical protein
MVINIRLSDRQAADIDDPLGRDWYGYDPDATPDQLWANNRGDYFLDAASVARERWAALNYKGWVVLVSELSDPGYEILAGKAGRAKKALIGRVLPTGHSIHHALIGRQVEYAGRNSISYKPDPEYAEAADADLPESCDQPGAGRQGLQRDTEVRRAIEDAAQDRLMRLDRDDGWTVTDTRQNRPYDAVAVRGTEQIYLEAKGTQSAGQSVIVTRNEVDHARRHPGQCWIGVWSGIRFKDEHVDPEAGTFRVVPFEPDDRDLRPRDYDWALPGDPL